MEDWRGSEEPRVYRDWAAGLVGAGLVGAHAHPPACARMPMSTKPLYTGEIL